MTDLPVTTTSTKEATVVGAAMVGFTGVGRHKSIQSALDSMDTDTRTFRPGENKGLYESIYRRYAIVAESDLAVAVQKLDEFSQRIEKVQSETSRVR